MLHKIYMQHKKKVICYELEAQTQGVLHKDTVCTSLKKMLDSS